MIAPVPFFEARGTPISVLGRLRALSSLGHEVDLLTYHLGKDVSIPGIKIHRAPNIPFIKDVPVGPSLSKVFLDIFLIVKAYRMLRHKHYDLIHTHEEACWFGAILTKIFRVRLLYEFGSSLPQVLRSSGYGRFWFLILLFEWLERWVIHSTHALIVISPALADYVKKINDKVPLAVIENAIDIVDPKPISEEVIQNFKLNYPQLEGKKIVLYTGTLEPYQGIDLLISSAERILEIRNDVMFVLVGGKPNQVKDYKNLATKNGFGSHFLFTGIRPPEEIPIYINIADALVSPRISGNNTPLKIYSYLQSGKPIIATNHISHTQVLSPEVAILVESEPQALAHGIISVLDNPIPASKIGGQARAYFESRYNYQTLIKKTEEILQAVIEKDS